LPKAKPIDAVEASQLVDRRIVALRRYHASRPQKTREKLNEALDRMLAGTTVIVDPKNFKLNKATLAKEAGVSIHTLLKKEKTGGRRFAEVIARLESEKPSAKTTGKSDDERDQKIAELRSIVAEIGNDKLNLARQLDRVALELLTTKQEADELRQDNHEQLQELLSLKNRVVTQIPRSGPRRKR
jgi:hypothetical protein